MDRGPDSAGVIETAMALRAAGRKVRFLMGNHEEVFLRACRKNDAKITRFFIRIGGEATVLSYPITRAEYMALDMHELSERLRTLVPQSHLEFIDSFEDQIVIGDYAFVHAGIRPGVPLAEQKPSDLRWIREEFVEHRGDLEKVVIYGHTIYDKVEERGSRIGIDTGAYASAELTAIGLEGGERCLLALAATSPAIAEEKANPERLKADVEKLVSFGTRHTLSSATDPKRGIGAARAWAKAEFEKIAQSCKG
eukprot:gene26899-48352_t